MQRNKNYINTLIKIFDPIAITPTNKCLPRQRTWRVNILFVMQKHINPDCFLSSLGLKVFLEERFLCFFLFWRSIVNLLCIFIRNKTPILISDSLQFLFWRRTCKGSTLYYFCVEMCEIMVSFLVRTILGESERFS